VLSIVPNKTPTGRIAMPIELVELRSEAELGEALRFYERLGFERPGYSMQRALR
jgi:hypothetical protein